MFKILLVGGGGAVGALLRYWITALAQRLTGGVFPIGTLGVNVLGCLLIGVFAAVLGGPWLIRQEYRVALLVGVLGALTTFSTFGWETVALTNDGQFRLAATNILLNNGLGLTGVWLGYRMAEKWFGV